MDISTFNPTHVEMFKHLFSLVSGAVEHNELYIHHKPAPFDTMHLLQIDNKFVTDFTQIIYEFMHRYIDDLKRGELDKETTKTLLSFLEKYGGGFVYSVYEIKEIGHTFYAVIFTNKTYEIVVDRYGGPNYNNEELLNLINSENNNSYVSWIESTRDIEHASKVFNSLIHGIPEK